jgi:hypothetical protein
MSNKHQAAAKAIEAACRANCDELQLDDVVDILLGFFPEPAESAPAPTPAKDALELIGAILNHIRYRTPDCPCPDCTEALNEAAAEAEAKALREALDWALRIICEDRVIEDDETPKHVCDYIHNPDTGYCEFHDKYWNARALLAHEAPKDESAKEEPR